MIGLWAIVMLLSERGLCLNFRIPTNKPPELPPADLKWDFQLRGFGDLGHLFFGEDANNARTQATIHIEEKVGPGEPSRQERHRGGGKGKSCPPPKPNAGDALASRKCQLSSLPEHAAVAGAVGSPQLQRLDLRGLWFAFLQLPILDRL